MAISIFFAMWQRNYDWYMIYISIFLIKIVIVLMYFSSKKIFYTVFFFLLENYIHFFYRLLYLILLGIMLLRKYFVLNAGLAGIQKPAKVKQ